LEGSPAFLSGPAARSFAQSLKPAFCDTRGADQALRLLSRPSKKPSPEPETHETKSLL
jgi:hypothetical protein